MDRLWGTWDAGRGLFQGSDKWVEGDIMSRREGACRERNGSKGNHLGKVRKKRGERKFCMWEAIELRGRKGGEGGLGASSSVDYLSSLAGLVCSFQRTMW